eukprot:GHVU01083216.1.p1 GENE.GHVU01083216.1~~GHVU01083216.1.p1  ORF type:complete len:207 (-),score=19.43 GHVU01083216.1:1657-2277(-)
MTTSSQLGSGSQHDSPASAVGRQNPLASITRSQEVEKLPAFGSSGTDKSTLDQTEAATSKVGLGDSGEESEEDFDSESEESLCTTRQKEATSSTHNADSSSANAGGMSLDRMITFTDGQIASAVENGEESAGRIKPFTNKRIGAGTKPDISQEQRETFRRMATPSFGADQPVEQEASWWSSNMTWGWLFCCGTSEGMRKQGGGPSR